MTSEDRSHALENILQRLCLVLGQVERCVIVSEEGLPVASYPLDAEANGAGQMPERLPERLNENAELAGLAAALAGAGERAMQRLAQGKAGRLVLEGESGTMLSLPVGEVSLAVLVASDANLAQVLFAAQKAAEEIAAVLAPD